VFFALRQQIPPHLLAQRSQRIELLVGAFLSGAIEPSTQNLLHKGALLYCVGLPDKSRTQDFPFPISALIRS